MQRGQLSGHCRVQLDQPVDGLFKPLEGKVAQGHCQNPGSKRRGRKDAENAKVFLSPVLPGTGAINMFAAWFEPILRTFCIILSALFPSVWVACWTT